MKHWQKGYAHGMADALSKMLLVIVSISVLVGLGVGWLIGRFL